MNNNTFRYSLFRIVIFCLLLLNLSASAETHNIIEFDNIYEPSGVTQLSNGDIVIIEDEADAPLWVMELVIVKGRLVLQEKKRIMLHGKYDDLEALAAGDNDDLFLITSHSTKKSGSRKRNREQLIKIQLRHDGVIEETTSQLYSPIQSILSNHSGVAQQHQEFNIEGMSFFYQNGKNNGLLLGLRSPVALGNHALVIKLHNPYAAVSAKQPADFDKKVSKLNIQGGIRAICYDRIARRYIIANEIEGASGKDKVVLWSWKGDESKPTRLNIEALGKLKNVEGISIISFNDKSYLLLVCDDGNKEKNKGAHYLILDYAEL